MGLDAMFTIKPLEWKERRADYWIAETILNQYSATVYLHEAQWYWGFGPTERKCDSPDEGKQLAEQHWREHVSQALVAAPAGDEPTTYADGYCAHCSELAYPLTRALEATGVPTGAERWQQTYGPNNVKSLADADTSLRRILNLLDDPKTTAAALKVEVERAQGYLKFHAEVRRRLTAEWQQREYEKERANPSHY